MRLRNPFRRRRRYHIRGSWDRPGDNGRLDIGLIPSRAFGEGYHSTTRVFLKELEAELRAGDYVLDVGTGTGILGIAALRLGARWVVAIDNAPHVVQVAATNFANNRLPNVTPFRGTLAEYLAIGDPGAKADLVVQNIDDLPVILENMALVQGVLRPGGKYAVSPDKKDVPVVVATARQNGLKKVHQVDFRGRPWSYLLFQKKGK